MEDTIAAISTPAGQGGIAIVRISGPQALAVADAVCRCAQGRPSTFPTHTIHFGRIVSDGDVIDHVMLSVMRAPRTYTAEDTVEINCHGGMLTARNILSLCLTHGARLAQPGEFTKRAFLNGRVDLTQAESVMDLISAKTDRAHTAAVHAMEGHLSKRIDSIRDQLLTALAHIEAQIDFPEEDITPASRAKLAGDLAGVIADLRKLQSTAREGKLLREGIVVAIVGRPNVGKSSLLNALLGEERSIVAEIPGTTRDTIQEFANIRGIPMHLTDTAGFRISRGQIESLGINRTLKALQIGDLLLHVLDRSRPFSVLDKHIVSLCAGKPTIRVLNKTDLPARMKLPANLPKCLTVPVCCLTAEGLDTLREHLERIALAENPSADSIDVTVNERQADSIHRALIYLTESSDSIQHDAPLEVVAQTLREALSAVGEVSGKTATENLLERIFSTFCIGK
jgi:tRNA modification GTPase